LSSELVGPFDRGRGGPGGWWILAEPELHLSSDVIVPDLAGWRRQHVPALPDSATITNTPDWVCEVISPATEALDRGRKLAAFAREGVGHARLLNPGSRTLEVFALAAGRWTLLAARRRAGAPASRTLNSISAPLWS
jgi:Uma2 family endonuclease